MHVKLSQGDARIWVKFDETRPSHHYGVRRTTTITLQMEDESISAVAICSRKDNFCKRTGRKLALHKLLYGHTKGRAMGITSRHLITSATFNADDRRKLWQAVCPEFFRGKPA